MSRPFRHIWIDHVTADDSPATAIERVVAWTLTLYLNDDTHRAWPSIATIAARAGINSDRTVRSALTQLEAHGFLVIQHKPGRSSTFTAIYDPGSSYRPTPATDTEVPRQSTTATPVIHDTTPVAATDKPGTNPVKNHDGAALRADGAALAPPKTCELCGTTEPEAFVEIGFCRVSAGEYIWRCDHCGEIAESLEARRMDNR